MPGELTFLLTDVQDSTRLWEESPRAMATALRRHDEIIRGAVAEYRGHHKPARGEGDSHFAVFSSPMDAVKCALHVQRSLASEDWPDEAAISVRIGLHRGEVEERGGDYYGPTVNRAARLRAIAHGGQTILSAAVADAVQPLDAPELDFRDRGRHRLKDLEEPMHVFELRHPELRDDFPPLMSLDGRRHNLPLQLTSFIGREDEIGMVTKLLDEDHRLVTLAGSGGIGKTRLSVQVAAELVDAYPEGVWLVELAPLTDPARLPQVMLAALDGPAESDSLDDLVTHLSTRRTLIVLDNCEHVVAAAAQAVEAILGSCPGVAVLATTREPLSIPGERVIRLGGMPLPDGDDDRLAEVYPGVRLFVERAAAVEPTFALDEEATLAVTRICRRLDGLPLAIELAAARASVLSAQQIDERLANRFTLLTGGPRTRDARQRTMRAAIDWSHDLLEPDEAVFFRRLSVFVGGWTLYAAETVCGSPPLASSAVIDLLAGLVDKSLVVVEAGEATTRYRMLESIRFYAGERLEEAGELTEVRSAHLAWMVEQTRAVTQVSEGDVGAATIAWFRSEPANIRAALDHAVQVDPAAGLSLMWNLLDAWETYSVSAEALSRLEILLTRHQEPDGTRLYGLSMLGQLAMTHGRTEVARASFLEAIQLARLKDDGERLTVNLVYLANLENLAGDADEAEALLREGEQIARQSDNEGSLAFVLAGLGRLRAERDVPQSIALFDEALRIRRARGEQGHVRNLLDNLTNAYVLQGNFAAARASAEEAREIAAALGDDDSIVTLSFSLGTIAQEEGDFAGADALFREAATFAEERGLPNEAGYAWALLGECSRAMGDLDGASANYSRSLEFLHEVGNLVTAAFISSNLGHIALRREDWAEARRLAITALRMAREKDIGTLQMEGMELCAEVAAATGEPERALRVFGAAEVLREQVGKVRDLVDQADFEPAAAAARAAVGNEKADVLGEAGRRAGPDAVTAELLSG